MAGGLDQVAIRESWYALSTGRKSCFKPKHQTVRHQFNRWQRDHKRFIRSLRLNVYREDDGWRPGT